MIKRNLGILMLAAGSLLSLASPNAAQARDRYYNDGYGYMTPHQRHEYEKQQRRELREERKNWERLQRERARSGYYRSDPYYRNNTTYRDGYYDRYGVYHSYRR